MSKTKVKARVKQTTFAHLPTKLTVSIPEQPDNTLDNGGTKHLMIFDPCNCKEYHINNARPYSKQDFRATHNFGMDSLKKGMGTYNRGNWSRLPEYYSGQIQSQQVVPDSKRVIYSRVHAGGFETKTMDLSETSMTELPDVKSSWLSYDSKEHFLSDRYISLINEFFGISGFKNVVEFSNGNKIDPKKVIKRANFSFRIPERGVRAGKPPEKTIDKMTQIAQQFFVKSRHAKTHQDLALRIVILGKDGTPVYDHTSTSADGFDWVLGKSFEESDIKQTIDTGWLSTKEGTVRFVVDFYKHHQAGPHAQKYGGLNQHSRLPSISRYGAPFIPSTMFVLVTQDERHSKPTKFLGTRFPNSVPNCFETLGIHNPHNSDGYMTGLKETVFYKEDYARSCNVSKSGAKNDLDVNYDVLEKALKRNQHPDGESWYDYLKTCCSEHRLYNKNIKKVLQNQESLERAKEIVSVELFEDEDISINDLLGVEEQEENEKVGISLPKPNRVNRNWGVFKIKEIENEEFMFANTDELVPFWYEREWDTTAEKYQDFLVINKSTEFGQEWHDKEDNVMWVRAITELVRNSFANHKLRQASFCTEEFKQTMNITFQTYLERSFDQIFSKTKVSDRKYITPFDTVYMLVKQKKQV